MITLIGITCCLSYHILFFIHDSYHGSRAFSLLGSILQWQYDKVASCDLIFVSCAWRSFLVYYIMLWRRMPYKPTYQVEGDLLFYINSSLMIVYWCFCHDMGCNVPQNNARPLLSSLYLINKYYQVFHQI